MNVREQTLIDIIFNMAQISAYHWGDLKRNTKKIENEKRRLKYYDLKREAHMAWVADQLKQCGFETIPMGSSWGVLKD